MICQEKVGWGFSGVVLEVLGYLADPGSSCRHLLLTNSGAMEWIAYGDEFLEMNLLSRLVRNFCGKFSTA